jgi:hypothetical protein
MREPTGRFNFCEYLADFGNNALYSDINRPDTLQIIQEKSPAVREFALKFALLLTLVTVISACAPAANTASAPATMGEKDVLNCGTDGYLRAQLYGALTATLAWDRNDLECTGMPRPEGRGARLRFAGTGPGEDQRLAIIIAIPELTREALGTEYRSNVTLIEEGAGRFFSTPNLDNCLTDVTSLTALDDAGGRFSIGGTLYCVTPLPEVNGSSSVSFSDMHFMGLVDWSSS